jgi:glycosyltransferase involved in cell wall biosynthesis
VLQIVQNLNYGGMERLLADLLRRLEPHRFERHLLALEYLGRFSEGLEGFAELHLSEPLSRYSMLKPEPLVRQIRRIAPDVVHTHSGVWYKASLAARRAGVPFLVHTDHGRKRPDPWPDRILDGLASRRTDQIVAVSAVLGEQLAATVVRDPSRIRVIPNGVDTAVHRPRPDSGRIRRELGIAPEAPIIGSIGRLESIKGYDVMLGAFAALRQGWGAGPPPVLVVAGDGSERAKLEALARSHTPAGSVHLLGWRDDVGALHEAFSLFTMSSRSEGTSVSLLEAMSAGLCPVVTDVGGNAAVLGTGLRHRLVPPEDPVALAAAWRSVLDDAVAAAADARAARGRVEEQYGIEAMVRSYEALYELARGTAPAV